MTNIEPTLTNNVAAIVTCSVFIWYLVKRDKSAQDTYEKLANAIDRMSKRLSELADALSKIDHRLSNVEENTTKRRKSKNA